MTITQPLALTAGYMTKQFVNVGQTQIPDVFGSLANPTATMSDSVNDSTERAQTVSTGPAALMGPPVVAKTGVTKRTNAYIVGQVPTAGTVSAKVACCCPNQDFLRDFYDSASVYGGTVPAGIIP